MKAVSALLVLLLTLASAFGDAKGFIWSSRVWEQGELMVGALLKAAGGYAFGITMYWLALRFAPDFGVVSTEAQTITWFAATIVGVAVFSGAFASWGATEQALAVLIVFQLGVLLYRTGG